MSFLGAMIGYLARAVARLVPTEWKPGYCLGQPFSSERNAQISLLKRKGMPEEMACAIFHCMRQFYGGEGTGLPGRA